MILPIKKAVARYAKEERAAATIEYIALLFPLLAIVLTSFQIALAYHFTLTAQQAVELGARIAAVRDPVADDMPERNGIAVGFTAGQSCAIGACTPPGGPWVCGAADLGGACDPVAYDAIFSEVARIAYLLDPNDLTITYFDGGLGFADGPFTPIVEVAIQDKPFFLQFFFSFATDDSNDEGGALRLPAVAAAAIAEDLSSTN